MRNIIRIPWQFVLVSICLIAAPAHAELKMPKVGATTTWECTGPYGEALTYTVVRVENGIIRAEGVIRGRGEVFAEQTLVGIGTTLFKERDRADGKGVRGQKYNDKDFEDYVQLEPGSKFSGKVKEWNRQRMWDWDYKIEVGDPKTINHKVFGEIEVVPVLENRAVRGGRYKSEMNMLVYPELGLELSVIYKDGTRDYVCDVTSYE